MKKSLLNIVTQLQKQLMVFPSIVTLLELKDTNFVPQLYAWIKECEEIMKNNGLTETAEMAGQRSKILATRFSEEHRTSAKKLQSKVAAELLYEVQATVVKIVKPYEQKIEECRELISHLLNIVCQSESIKYNNEKEDFQVFLNNLWTLFTSHQQLKPGAIKLQSYLSHHDVLRIMAEEINLADWQSDTAKEIKEATKEAKGKEAFNKNNSREDN